VDSIPEPPAPDELEVSVFGTGYGEAILLHIGGGSWICVDSCIGPQDEVPAQLSYLKDLGVPFDSVKLVVASHWHDDHIRGLANLFEQCKSTDLVISSALSTREFASLVAPFEESRITRDSGVEEFVQILHLLEDRRQKGARFNPPKYAAADRILYSNTITQGSGNARIKVLSLSPSDAAVHQALLAFAEAVPRVGQRRRRVASPRPNHAAVVLWVEAGCHNILLGADLEETHDPKTGWSVIVAESSVAPARASVFKVPHHGSENAHFAPVWSQLLHSDPIAIVTPFNLGRVRLPSETDVERIASLTSHAYITGRVRKRRARVANRAVRKMVRDVARSLQDIEYSWGQIRLRKAIADTTPGWEVSLFGDAEPLNAA